MQVDRRTGMHAFQQEIAAFAERKAAELSEARRRVALRLSCGMDLPDPAQADRATTMDALGKARRAMKRERMKALHRHWSYDLNRHIALKEACDEMERALGLAGGAQSIAANENGARRRRRR
jgi:hypothetical protein